MVLEKIKAILSEQFSVEESEITAETLLEATWARTPWMSWTC